jgi:hypothetical protein
MRLGRSGLLKVLIVIASIVVCALVAMVGLGVLVLPTHSSPTVTVRWALFKIQQGTDKFGHGWFGPDEVNETNWSGFPIQVASGSQFEVVLSISNLDTVNHTIYSAVAAPPFSVAGSSPGLPKLVLSGEDDWQIGVYVDAPSVGSDATYGLTITLDAVPPP